jgi:hypothetical protein
MKLKRYFDDILLILGCILILIGVYQALPVATWFVAGGMCISFGVLVGLAGNEVKK